MAAATDLQRATIRIPDCVVRRAFPNETVVLNLETGRYHGLNSLAEAMLGAIEDKGTIPDAVRVLADRFDAAPDVIERDLEDFCRDMLDRGLIAVD